MKIDIVVPIKSSILSLAIEFTIPSILKHLEYNNLYILTKKENMERLARRFEKEIIILDEDNVCKGLSFDSVSKYLNNRIKNSNRAGWYFQQFLKLGFALRKDATEHYLIWDADAILLKPITFFDANGRIFVTKSTEHQTPFFKNIKNLLGIDKQVSFSFISEHLVFTKKHVMHLLNTVTCNSQIWWKEILDKVDPNYLNGNGFSEYELYGNYITHQNPNLFVAREVFKLRHGAKLFGQKPPSFMLKLFSLTYVYLSIETKHSLIRPKIKRYLLIIKLLLEPIYLGTKARLRRYLSKF